MNCKKCGMMLNHDDVFCSNCGEPVSVANQFNDTSGNQFFTFNNIDNNVNDMNNNVNVGNNYFNDNNVMNNASVNNNYVDNMNNGMNSAYVNQPNTMSSDYNNVTNVNGYSNGNINIQNGNQNKNSNKIVILIAIILVIIVGVGLIVFLTKDKDNKPGSVDIKDYDSYEDYEKAEKERKEKHEIELNKNFSYKVHELANGDLLIEFVNKNDENATLDGEITYYDENGVIVETNVTYANIDKENKYYMYEYVPDNYARYEVNVKLKETYHISDTKNIEVVSVEDSDKYSYIEIKEVKLKCNVKDQMKVYAIMIFYDSNNKIIGASNSYLEMKGNNTYMVEFRGPENSEYDSIPYARYELHYVAYHYDLDE